MTFPEGNETPKVDAVAEPAQVPQPATPPSYITKDELNQAFSALSQKIDQMYRGVQSKTDQFSSKMQKKIETLEGAAKAAGIPLSDQQKGLMTEIARFQTLSEDAAQPQGFAPGQAQPQGNANGELYSRVNQAAETMQKAANVEFVEGDPELAIMEAVEDSDKHSPQEYLAAVQKAIDAKQARLKNPPAPSAPASPGLVKGVAQSNPIENINNLDELWKQAKVKLG